MTLNSFNFQTGLSLKYAYQPKSEAETIALYHDRPCMACGASLVGEKLPPISRLQLGEVFFVTLPKPCSCGYTNEIKFVFNDLMRSVGAAVISANEAIARAEAEGLLLDPELEEQLVVADIAVHQGKPETAIALYQSLTVRFPQSFLPFSQMATILSRQQRYQESLAACEAALKRNPTHLETIGTKAFVLFQLDRLQEAGKTYEQWRRLHPDGTVILEEEVGKFGLIQIIDDSQTRSLWIDEQRQGLLYKQPGADEWEPTCRSGPGPISSSFFAAGFLLVGCLKPQGSGLVLGLGCAAGIVMSLACFPHLHLTVVEVDPTMVRMCLTFFPLVQHYLDAGRLEIVTADAQDFLLTNDRHFDFLQCDAYDGRSQLPDWFTSIAGVERMAATAPLLSLNIMGQLNRPHLHQVLSRFDAVGRPIQMLYPGLEIHQAETIPTNWLALTEAAIVPDDFVPFARLSGVGIERLKHNLAMLNQNAMSREQVRSYKVGSRFHG